MARYNKHSSGEEPVGELEYLRLSRTSSGLVSVPILCLLSASGPPEAVDDDDVVDDGADGIGGRP